MNASSEFHHTTEAQLRSLSECYHAIQEDRAKRLVIECLPRTGPWLIKHPRALRWLFRVRPGLRPMMTVVMGSTAIASAPKQP